MSLLWIMSVSECSPTVRMLASSVTATEIFSPIATVPCSGTAVIQGGKAPSSVP